MTQLTDNQPVLVRAHITESGEQVSPLGMMAKVMHWGFILVLVYALFKQAVELHHDHHECRWR